MRKLFTLFLAIVASVSALLAEVTIDGMTYYFTSEGAVVSSFDPTTYYAVHKDSVVVIPEYVEYEGQKYNVVDILINHQFNGTSGGSTSTYAFNGCIIKKMIWQAKYCKDSFGYWTYSSVSGWTTWRGYDNPFEYVTIKKLVIDDNVENIPSYLFAKASIDTVCLGSMVKNIGSWSFCSDRKSQYYQKTLVLPDSIQTIGTGAFVNIQFDTLVVGKSVQYIGSSAFTSSPISHIVWNAIHCDDFTSDNTIFYNNKQVSYDGTYVSSYDYCPNVDSFVFGEEVEYIPAYLCSRMTNVKKIEIPCSVTTFGIQSMPSTSTCEIKHQCNEVFKTETSLSLCEGERLMWNDTYISKVKPSDTGDYEYKTKTALYYDSIVTLHLKVNPIYSIKLKDTTLCYDEDLYINGVKCPLTKYPNSKQTWTQNLKTLEGCDSIVTISVKWNKLSDFTISTRPEYDTYKSGSISFYQSDYSYTGKYYYTLNGKKDPSLYNLSKGYYRLVFYSEECGDSIVKDVTIEQYGIKVNNQYYLLDTITHTAILTYRGTSPSDYNNEYSGDIIIPKTITYKEIEYQVTGINSSTFSGCNYINSVTMESETPISIYSSGLSSSSKIYVPFGSLSAYKSASGWRNHSLHVINPKHVAGTNGATSATITFGNDEEVAHIASCGMVESDTTAGNILEYIGLEPNSEYKDIPFFIITEEGDYDTLHYSFKTPALELTTKPSQPVSGTTALLFAETNMSDAETNCGFEYKRNDAPADMDGTKVFCPVASGTMAGRLKNLKDDVYYKYRAFYQSAAGQMYYGEWQYIFTGDIAVEFDPVLYTYSATVVKETEATISGYALAGAADFTEQGFEYWAESRVEAQGSKGVMKRMPAALGEHFFVQASGINMRVTLTNLDPGTVYKYRAYGKVGEQVYYGAEQSFTTRGTYVPPTFMITFVNWDGTELQKSPVAENTMPVYLGETPVRPETSSYTYTFKGWTPQLVAATADATYTATYTAKAKQQDTVYYTITFINWDETVLQRMKVEEGVKPVYTGETPVRPEDDNYTYTFAKWSPKIVEAYEDATYMATFTAEEKTQDLDNVQTPKVQCTKLIENGVLYLIFNGTKYNVQGQVVK